MKALRTLVVDDDRDFANGLADLVHACGHLAEVSTSGQAAISKLRNREYDIAFVDVKMPNYSGFDVAKSIKKGELPCEVLLMTAFNLEDALAEEVSRGSVSVVGTAILGPGISDRIRRRASRRNCHRRRRQPPERCAARASVVEVRAQGAGGAGNFSNSHQKQDRTLHEHWSSDARH